MCIENQTSKNILVLWQHLQVGATELQSAITNTNVHVQNKYSEATPQEIQAISTIVDLLPRFLRSNENATMSKAVNLTITLCSAGIASEKWRSIRIQMAGHKEIVENAINNVALTIDDDTPSGRFRLNGYLVLLSNIVDTYYEGKPVTTLWDEDKTGERFLALLKRILKDKAVALKQGTLTLRKWLSKDQQAVKLFAKTLKEDFDNIYLPILRESNDEEVISNVHNFFVSARAFDFVSDLVLREKFVIDKAINLLHSQMRQCLFQGITSLACFCDNGEVAAKVLLVDGIFKLLFNVLQNPDTLESIQQNIVVLLQCMAKYQPTITPKRFMDAGGIDVASKTYYRAKEQKFEALAKLILDLFFLLCRDQDAFDCIKKMPIAAPLRQESNRRRPAPTENKTNNDSPASAPATPDMVNSTPAPKRIHGGPRGPTPNLTNNNNTNL